MNLNKQNNTCMVCILLMLDNILVLIGTQNKIKFGLASSAMPEMVLDVGDNLMTGYKSFTIV